MNQTDFAAIANVTRRSQSNYETGERTPDTSYLVAISAVGADVSFIITGVKSDDSRDQAPSPAPPNPLNMKLMALAISELEGALKRHRKILDPERKARAVSVLYEYLEKLEQASPSGALEQAAVDRFMQALF